MYCWVAATVFLYVPGNMHYWVVAVGLVYFVVGIGCVPGPGIEGTAKKIDVWYALIHVGS